MKILNALGIGLSVAIMVILVCSGMALIILWMQGYTSVQPGQCAP